MDRFFSWCGGVITALREGFSSLTVGGAMALVAFSSGFISYTHISALTLAEGQSWKTAHLMPACIDGQIVIGSFYFMDGKNRWQKAAGLVLGVLPGIAESLFANWESGIVHGLLAAGWATVPAQAFACSTFLFERWLHNRRKDAPAAVRAAVVPVAEAAALVIPDLPLLHVHPAPAEAPWGLVSPAVPPLPVPRPQPARYAFPQVPVMGPHLPLNGQPKRERREPAVAEDRKPWPSHDAAEQRRIVAAMSRNEMYRTYDISKGKADELRRQFGPAPVNGKEVASRAA